MTRSSSTDGVPNTFKPGTAFSLFSLLLRLRYDLVHLHLGGQLTTRLIGLMLFCGAVARKKCVVTFHSGGYAATNGATASPRSLQAIAFRSMDHIIVVNREMMDMFLRFGVRPDRLSMIPPYVARRPSPDVTISDRVREFVDHRRPLLLTVGLLEPEYALDLQIDALEKVLERHPNAGLLIAGTGSLFHKLTESIAAKPYKKSILLAGDLGHDETLRVMELADLLLRPTHYDGDAVSVRESLFLGTRVIATDNGMRPPGVILIPMPPDPTQLAEKIIETLETPRASAVEPLADGSENITSVISLYNRLGAETK